MEAGQGGLNPVPAGITGSLGMMRHEIGQDAELHVSPNPPLQGVIHGAAIDPPRRQSVGDAGPGGHLLPGGSETLYFAAAKVEFGASAGRRIVAAFVFHALCATSAQGAVSDSLSSPTSAMRRAFKRRLHWPCWPRAAMQGTQEFRPLSRPREKEQKCLHQDRPSEDLFRLR